MGELGIPSVCPEVGQSNLFAYDFTLPYRAVLDDVLEGNIDWLEYTYKKIGNHFKVEPIAYHLSNTLSQNNGLQSQITVTLKVSNFGLTDQIIPNFQIELNTALDGNQKHVVQVNDLKKRSHQILAYTFPITQETAL